MTQEKKHLSKTKLSIILAISLLLFAFSSFYTIAYFDAEKNIAQYAKKTEMVNYKTDFKLRFSSPARYMMGDYFYIHDIEMDNLYGQKINIKKFGFKETDLNNLNIDITVDQLSLPVSVFYWKDVPELIQNYLDAFEFAGVRKHENLNISADIFLKHTNDNLKGDLFLSIDKLTAIKLSFDLNNFDIDAFRDVTKIDQSTTEGQIEYQMESIMLLQALEINNLDLTLTNQGLADGIVQQTAVMMGISEDEAREQILTQINLISQITNQSGSTQNEILMELLVLLQRELMDYFK